MNNLDILESLEQITPKDIAFDDLEPNGLLTPNRILDNTAKVLFQVAQFNEPDREIIIKNICDGLEDNLFAPYRAFKLPEAHTERQLQINAFLEKLLPQLGWENVSIFQVYSDKQHPLNGLVYAISEFGYTENMKSVFQNSFRIGVNQALELL